MPTVIKDSTYSSLEEAVAGSVAPPEVLSTLALIEVRYLSFDGKVHQGQLVLHKGLVEDVQHLFHSLLAAQFPLEKCVPIVAYDWDDEASMRDNNCSAFCYRPIMGTDRLSNHSFGTALDLNPRLNPYFARDGKVYPEGATYDPSVMGTITATSDVVALFKALGWEWGGDWESVKDFQHFQKLLVA